MEGLFELGINPATLLAQVVNFVVLFVLLYLVAYKPILKLLDDRSRKVEESLKQAEAVKEQVAHAEDESKKRLEAASKEGQEIIARAVKTGEDVRAQAQQDARKDGESLISRARAEIQRERDEAIGELRREFADLTISAAEKVIEQSLDKEAHRNLIDRALEQNKTFGKG
jgi:F-type H+-transporting ATPase subunit b